MKSVFTVANVERVEQYRDRITSQSTDSLADIKELIDHAPLQFLARMKFGKLGKHPIEDRSINFIEQLNQTFTYLTALEAAKLIFEWHPDCGGLTLSPGAYAPKKPDGEVRLDIESAKLDYVGGETFSAATPKSNQKIYKDLDKLAGRNEKFRYIFFSSPEFPKTERQVHLERDGIHVWSVELGDFKI